MLQRQVQRIGHHHHAGAAPEGTIVDRTVQIGRHITRIPEMHIPQTSLFSAGRDAEIRN